MSNSKKNLRELMPPKEGRIIVIDTETTGIKQ